MFSFLYGSTWWKENWHRYLYGSLRRKPESTKPCMSEWWETNRFCLFFAFSIFGQVFRFLVHCETSQTKGPCSPLGVALNYTQREKSLSQNHFIKSLVGIQILCNAQQYILLSSIKLWNIGLKQKALLVMWSSAVQSQIIKFLQIPYHNH